MLTPFKSKTTHSVTSSYKKLNSKIKPVLSSENAKKNVLKGKQFNGESRNDGTMLSFIMGGKK